MTLVIFTETAMDLWCVLNCDGERRDHAQAWCARFVGNPRDLVVGHDKL